MGLISAAKTQGKSQLKSGAHGLLNALWKTTFRESFGKAPSEWGTPLEEKPGTAPRIGVPSMPSEKEGLASGPTQHRPALLLQ